MKTFISLGLFLAILFFNQFYNSHDRSSGDNSKKEIINNKWQLINTIEENGLLGERLDLWRDKRLWFVADSGFLLSGFESRPGVHPWQGEHVGKWLHAATLAYEVTEDEKLKKELDNTVERLLATQLHNGYMGTYIEDKRFYVKPEAFGGWDIWTHRYNLYGLLTYEKFHPDESIVDACKKMGDLLIETFGEGKTDITKYGTRKGISSTHLLESIVMLYERTLDEKYLNFAEQIVFWSEQNPGLRLMDAMLKNESVVFPGEGKAYQLMANLLGYYRLYLCTGNDNYLQTALNGWKDIKENHILVTGGPWSRKMPYNGNRECFAKPEDFEPGLVVVENCCTVTWIQLNLHLFELTGLAMYAEEAEKALFNHLLGAQHVNGIDWCYFTPPNEKTRAFEPGISCCASSGPRALEMFSGHLAGEIENHLSINSFSPSTIVLPGKFGGGKINIKGNFPYTSTTHICFETDQIKEFTIEFRSPLGTTLTHAKINGKKVKAEKNDRGFFQIKNKWKPGDILSIELDYQLELHVQTGEKGKKWVAFSYGPLVLSQETNKDMQLEEPFKDVKIDINEPGKILEMLSKSEQDHSDITFTINGTRIKLVPYHLVGSRVSGPRTYFECSN